MWFPLLISSSSMVEGSGLGSQAPYSQLLAQEKHSCLAASLLRRARRTLLAPQSRGLQDVWPCQMVVFRDKSATSLSQDGLFLLKWSSLKTALDLGEVCKAKRQPGQVSVVA